ncbi:hypothetical protein [Candidatus Hecatella orcuttiae]|uniref:hypothetical protein n=1 Tax=Candidatus Hecatella orcuttiae TaxID=1935119 RepID=UPI002868165C|nr:hypothetical protein [Candidatus Hecatella orcuttiae]
MKAMMSGQKTSLSQRALEALCEVTPYLQNLEWLRGLLNDLLSKVKTFTQLIEALERECKGQRDTLKQTDLKIYSQYLRRFLRENP